MRVVIDTNVLVSYFLNNRSTVGQVMRILANKGATLIFTDATLGELISVLYRSKFDRYTTPALRQEFLRNIIEVADRVDCVASITACRDPNDDKFLDACVHGRADCLITGDQDLLALHPFREIAIVSPTEFLLR